MGSVRIAADILPTHCYVSRRAIFAQDVRLSVVDCGLCCLYFDERMTEINVCDAHEIVGRILFVVRLHPILDFSDVAACVMFTASDPSISAAFKEFASKCNKSTSYC